MRGIQRDLTVSTMLQRAQRVHQHEAWDEDYTRGYEWWIMKEAKKVSDNEHSTTTLYDG